MDFKNAFPVMKCFGYTTFFFNHLTQVFVFRFLSELSLSSCLCSQFINCTYHLMLTRHNKHLQLYSYMNYSLKSITDKLHAFKHITLNIINKLLINIDYTYTCPCNYAHINTNIIHQYRVRCTVDCIS